MKKNSLMSFALIGLIFSLNVFAGTAFAATEALQPGQTAPDFSLKGADGKTYKLSQFKDKVVVIEWFNKDCPYVRKFYDGKNMQALQKAHTAKGGVWLTIASSAKGKEGHMDQAAAAKVYADSTMASTALLLDSEGQAAKAYQAKTTPHMFVIDKKGKLAYLGAIDDRPSANKKTLDGAQNYITAAVSSLEKGEPVKLSSTAPYGCSVKY